MGFWNNQTFIILMIKIGMTLNEDQGQYNYHVMHSHAWGSYRAKLTMMTSRVSEESLARDRRARMHARTHVHTHTHTHTHTRTDSGSRRKLKCAKSWTDFPNKDTPKTEVEDRNLRNVIQFDFLHLFAMTAKLLRSAAKVSVAFALLPLCVRIGLPPASPPPPPPPPPPLANCFFFFVL